MQGCKPIGIHTIAVVFCCLAREQKELAQQIPGISRNVAGGPDITH